MIYTIAGLVIARMTKTNPHSSYVIFGTLAGGLIGFGIVSWIIYFYLFIFLFFYL